MIRAVVRRRSRAAQAGYTLIELLLVLGILGIIFVPLMAWAGLAMRQQPVLEDGLLRTASAGLLGSYLPRDVKIAGKAADDTMTTQPWARTDCVGGAGSNGAVKLVLITGGDSIEKVVYSSAPGRDDPAQQSVWRRVCNPSTGTLSSAEEVFADVQPGSTTAVCSSEPGDRPCRQIEMRVTPRSTQQVVTVRATRRLDESAIPTDLYGNPTPTADIEILSRSGSMPMTATFSGQRSTAAAGRSIVSYRWEFDGPGAVTVVGGSSGPTVQGEFAVEGNYTVRLTVTDDLGLTSTSYTPILTSNQHPVARATATPASAANGTTYSLDGRASYDPDGTVSAYDWIVDYPSTGGRETFSGPVVQVTPGAGVVGTISVMLVVSDAQGSQGNGFTSFEVVDPAAPTTTTTTVPGQTTVPTTDPGSNTLVVAYSDTAAGGVSRSFDASPTTGVGAGNSATYSWDFGDNTSGSGATLTHTFPNAGTYSVRLTVSTSDSRSGSTSRSIEVGSAPPAPVDVRHDGANVLWSAVPGARRYLIDFEYRTANDCLQVISNQAVGAVPNPFKAIPSNPCPPTATARARVGTDANGVISWSDWIAVPTINGTTVPVPTPVAPTTPEVVK